MTLTREQFLEPLRTYWDPLYEEVSYAYEFFEAAFARLEKELNEWGVDDPITVVVARCCRLRKFRKSSASCRYDQ